MKRLLAAALTISVLAIAPHYAFAKSGDGKEQIEQVVQTFRNAIVKKDKDTFLSLFLKEDITWSGVTTDSTLDRLYATRPKPEMTRPRKAFNGSPRQFIGSVANNKARIDEVISNVRIDSDGDVAQVWFDYSFMTGDYKENWGKESWQMVRTDAGWKIAAVVWSQELNPVDPPGDAGH